MRVHGDRWNGAAPAQLPAQGERLVLAFGARRTLASEWGAVVAAFPGAAFLGCSTLGEIIGASVTNDTLAVARVDLDRTRVRTASTLIDGAESVTAGERLADQLAAPDLQYVLVLSNGLRVNGSEFVRGLTAKLEPGVTVTGGLAGDGDAFEETVVVVGSELASGQIGAVGFYGNSLCISTGSLGGWDSFGPEASESTTGADPTGDEGRRFDGGDGASLELALAKRLLAEMGGTSAPLARAAAALSRSGCRSRH